MDKISVHTLLTLFTRLSIRDLVAVSCVCGAWRRASLYNLIWLDRFRDQKLVLEVENIERIVKENEEQKQKMKQEFELEYDLTQQVKMLDKKIALLVKHKTKMTSPPTPSRNSHEFGGYSTKMKHSRSITAKSCMINSPSEVIPLGGNSGNKSRTQKTKVEMLQVIMAVFQEIEYGNIEEIQTATQLFKFFSRSKVATRPQFLFNASEIFMFIKNCDKRSTAEQNSGFLRSLYIAVMREMHALKTKTGSNEELHKATQRVAELNDQIVVYEKILKDILSGYSKLCKGTTIKFSHHKLVSKGVITASSVPFKDQKHTTFTIVYAINGIFQFTVQIRSQVVDIIHLNMAQLLEKMSESNMSIDYGQLTVHVPSMLQLLEKKFFSTESKDKTDKSSFSLFKAPVSPR